MSIDRWIDKEVVGHIQNGIMPFAATRMDLEIIILSDVSQTKTNIIWYFLYVESKKMLQMNAVYKTKIDLPT